MNGKKTNENENKQNKMKEAIQGEKHPPLSFFFFVKLCARSSPF